MAFMNNPRIDKSQFPHFLRVLDPDAKWFTIQTFTDSEQKPTPDPLAKVFNVSRITRAVLDTYAQGAGIYLTVNDTEGNGRKAGAVTRVRAVWQEDDDGYEGPFPIEPSFVVETSLGHFHRYWLTAGDWPADEQGRRDFAGVMARMVASYGSDPGAKDISRVLRLPGFLHRKSPDDPHMVRVIGGNRQHYLRAEILAGFPPLDSPTGKSGNGHDAGGEGYAELVRGVLSSDTYHAGLRDIAWRQTGAGMPAGLIVEQLRGMMLSIPEEKRDDRWQARFASIPGLVNSAEGKNQPNRAERRAVESTARRLLSKRGDQIRLARISWVWQGRIARGKHTALAGSPGIGKSQLLIWIAATVSKGCPWPAGEGKAPLGSIVLLSAEDGAEDTIMPRFLAAGGDPTKLHVITATMDENEGVHTFNLVADLQALEAKIREVGDVVLVIIDPISSYMGATDSHRNTEVRGAIEPLSEMADRLGVAIVSNTHFSKAGGSTKTRALERVIGSIAFVGAPRAAFAVVEEADDTGRRLLLHLKNNIAPAAPGLAFTLEQAVAGYIDAEPLYASRIVWSDEPVNVTADQAIAEHEASLRGEARERAAPERDNAEAFLRSWLKDGPVDAKLLKRAALDAGITEKTFRIAKERLCESVQRRTDDGRRIEGWDIRLRPATEPLDDP
jgi:putative DNA primase/helicase